MRSISAVFEAVGQRPVTLQ